MDTTQPALTQHQICSTPACCDYLLYAADQEIITVAWSVEIMREVTEHLNQNVAGFDDAAAERLVSAMNTAYPLAEGLSRQKRRSPYLPR